MCAKAKSPQISWTKQFESMRTLSLRQPWAWLIVNGYKDIEIPSLPHSLTAYPGSFTFDVAHPARSIENRSWRTNHRGPLLIHASSTTTTLQADLRRVKDQYGVDVPENLEFGGLSALSMSSIA
jgi:hypothetical protein